MRERKKERKKERNRNGHLIGLASSIIYGLLIFVGNKNSLVFGDSYLTYLNYFLDDWVRVIL